MTDRIAPEDDIVEVSVVLATRNRGQLLARALASVMAQRGVRLEALIVDDGSVPDEALQVDATIAAAGPAAHLLRLAHRATGHGPSFARNTAAALARGELLAFLDDDDEWTDPQHLQRCVKSMRACASSAPASAGEPQGADVLFGDQRAIRPDGSEHPGPLWLRGLEKRLRTQADAQGARQADVDSLLAEGGMCHLNTTVLRRRLFLDLGGFDERLRYEEDRDLCLRAIDAARCVLYQPKPIGIHHIPDPSRRDNVTTAMHQYDKWLAQLLLLDKAQLNSQRGACRRYARRSKGQVLKHLAEHLDRQGRPRDSQVYRLQALCVDFSLKWLAYTALGALRTIGIKA